MSGQRASKASGQPGTAGGRSAWRDRITPTRILMLVLAALAIILIAENNRDVEIRLLVPVVTMPLYLALLMMWIIGVLCGALLVHSRAARRKHQDTGRR